MEGIFAADIQERPRFTSIGRAENEGVEELLALLEGNEKEPSLLREGLVGNCKALLCLITLRSCMMTNSAKMLVSANDSNLMASMFAEHR